MLARILAAIHGEMDMSKARQAGMRPSNKLTVGSGVAAFVGTQTAPLVLEVWPQVAPTILAGEIATQTVSMLVALAAGVAVGWFVPDAPNVPL